MIIRGANVRFRNRDSLIADGGRELGERAVYPYLGKDLRDVRIQIQVEVDPQFHRSIVGVEGTHVEHAFDARHRFFDRRCDRAFNGKGVRSDIVGGHYDFRWGDGRELGHGKSLGHDDSREYDQNGDHHCRNGPINKEFRH
jgi:hypothetical protein